MTVLPMKHWPRIFLRRWVIARRCAEPAEVRNDEAISSNKRSMSNQPAIKSTIIRLPYSPCKEERLYKGREERPYWSLISVHSRSSFIVS